MLAKYNKFLITTSLKLVNNQKPFYSLSTKFITSYFSKMNLKQKHSNEFKKQKANKNVSNTTSSNQAEGLSATDSTQSSDAQIKKREPEVNQRHTSWPSVIEALHDMKKQPIRGEHEVIQLTIGLNVDYRKGDQNVRGIFKMPGGSTKTPKVIAFVPPELADRATAAGADLIGDNETIKEIQNGQINFERCVCTIEMLPLLKSVGRILGPMGLMPNAKIGTATTQDKLETIIKDLKLGSKEFRVDPRGQIIVPVGKRDFPVENVLQNIHSYMTVLIEKKPDTIKGRYLLYSFLNARRLAYKIEMKSLDPKTNSYFMNTLKKTEEPVKTTEGENKPVEVNMKNTEEKTDKNKVNITEGQKKEKKDNNQEKESKVDNNNNVDDSQKENITVKI